MVSGNRFELIDIVQFIVIALGALASGFVSGLVGFGTGITAVGIWLYAVTPPVAAPRRLSN
jgi:uncharacterized protein